MERGLLARDSQFEELGFAKHTLDGVRRPRRQPGRHFAGPCEIRAGTFGTGKQPEQLTVPLKLGRVSLEDT